MSEIDPVNYVIAGTSHEDDDQEIIHYEGMGEDDQEDVEEEETQESVALEDLPLHIQQVFLVWG